MGWPLRVEEGTVGRLTQKYKSLEGQKASSTGTKAGECVGGSKRDFGVIKDVDLSYSLHFH